MAEIEVLLPKMGESVAEATITKWLKSVGETIEEDEPLAEIATDKVDSEVPSPAAGVLTKILFNEGDVVQVGAAFAIIGGEGDSDKPENEPTTDLKTEEYIEPIIAEQILEPLSNGKSNNESIAVESSRFYSPLVKSIASKEGVNSQELELIQGSGSGGRVTKKDMLLFLKTRTSSTSKLLTLRNKTQQFKKLLFLFTTHQMYLLARMMK